MKDTYKFSHKEYDHQFGKKLFAFILFILVNIGFTLTFPAKVNRIRISKPSKTTFFSQWSRVEQTAL